MFNDPLAGGNTTVVTFFDGGVQALTAGFGAFIIDADFPTFPSAAEGASFLQVFDKNGVFLGDTGTVSGSNASQLFRGIVTVDMSTNLPVPTIASAFLKNGSAWPGNLEGEGVTFDDFTFGITVVPEPDGSIMLLVSLATLALLRAPTALKRRRAGLVHPIA